MNRLPYIAFAAAGLIAACHAQPSLDQLNPLSSSQEGVHLYEVSVFTGYSTSAYPVGLGFVPSAAGALNSDVNYGVSASLGWQHHREKTNFAIRYSGAFSGMAHYSGANGYSQWLTLSADRKLAPKWNLNLSLTGQDATLVEVLNEPATLATTSSLPSDFNDFAAAFGLGSYSTAAAASMILGAPVVQAPLRTLLLGNKVLSYSGTAGLGYSFSEHLSFHASAFGGGGESRSGSLDGVPATNFVLPRSYGGTVGMDWHYSLSPRTDVGFDLQGSRLQNHFQSAFTSTATASIGRKLGPHWFAKIYGGATYTEVVQQLYGTPATKQAVGGAALGVKTFGNTLAATYDRAANDTIGSVIGTYTTIAASWSRRLPGSRMSMTASYGEQQANNTGFETFSGWTATAGISESLTETSGLSAQYVYFKTGGNYLGNASAFSVQSARLSMSWYPSGARR